MIEIRVECICCQECPSIEELSLTESISNCETKEDVENFAIESGAEFDCPECGERQYLSDCELY